MILKHLRYDNLSFWYFCDVHFWSGQKDDANIFSVWSLWPNQEIPQAKLRYATVFIHLSFRTKPSLTKYVPRYLAAGAVGFSVVHVVPGPELEAGRQPASSLSRLQARRQLQPRFLVWEISCVHVAGRERGCWLPSIVRVFSLLLGGLATAHTGHSRLCCMQPAESR